MQVIDGKRLKLRALCGSLRWSWLLMEEELYIFEKVEILLGEANDFDHFGIP